MFNLSPIAFTDPADIALRHLYGSRRSILWVAERVNV